MRPLDIEVPLALIPEHAKKVGLVGAAEVAEEVAEHQL